MPEYTIISAPNFDGFCKTGDAKTLSTITFILFSLANSQTAFISINSRQGFDGVSKKKIFVFGLISFFQLSIFFPSTNDTSIPYLVIIFFIISLQDPNRAVAETRWSPACSWHIIEAKTAAIPLEVAKQLSEPSIKANLFSKVSIVGLA